MPAWSSLLLFSMAAAARIITPGPAVLYIIACSLAHRRRAGVIAAMGTATGNLLHAVATTLGLSALLTSSALAFSVMQYCGAALLISQGLCKVAAVVRYDQGRQLLAATGTTQALPLPATRWGLRLFIQGVLVSLLNPVTLLFFCAILPQFVAPASGPVAAQMLVLGGVYVVLHLGNGSVYALLAGTWSRWLQGHAWCWRPLHGLIGGLYMGLGFVMACAGVDKG